MKPQITNKNFLIILYLAIFFLFPATNCRFSQSSDMDTDNTAPDVPQNLQANAISSSRIELAWDPSTDSHGVAGYHIYRGGNTSPVAEVTATSYTNSGLSPSTEYTYTVSAFDSAGNESGQSAPSSATTQEINTKAASIILLHHSTGGVIWNGGISSWFSGYNSDNSTTYIITERSYPKSSPYGWNNYPYDYWNIWVENAGNEQYLSEDTLEILTASYDVIIWKHCYPVSSISADTGNPDITSSAKRIENYKLQYNALKEKMHSFENNKFIVWTGAAHVQANTTEEQAERAQSFFNWVRDEWDEEGDNIFIWDFWQLETEGGLYLLDSYASSSDDSHPGSAFAAKAAPYLCTRIVDVIQGSGDTGSITGN